jgi:ubiquinone/menaquinone biosynthesis C-methylase UbiE
MMRNNISYISIGDFTDLFYKVKQKGYASLASLFHFPGQARTASKWNNATSSSDFWIIPEVRARWNEKCTGNPNLEYEDHVVSTFLAGRSGLKMLSVGCGAGSRERKFGNYPHFDRIEGIDVAAKLIEEARQNAIDAGLNNISYLTGDFTTCQFETESYDVVLFNSSLHHFGNLEKLIPEKILPLLKKGGLLVIFEYVGPNRLQWTTRQLAEVNRLMKELPLKYRVRFKSHSVKKRIYRPGLLRMKMVDPSEAIDSASILPAVHNHFSIVEEKQIGWDITHLLFKDIAHHFLDGSKETQQWLSYIFSREDEYINQTGTSDAVFGVYQK